MENEIRSVTHYFDLKDVETGNGVDLRITTTQEAQHQIEFKIMRDAETIKTFALDYYDGKLQLVIDDDDAEEPRTVPLLPEDA